MAAETISPSEVVAGGAETLGVEGADDGVNAAETDRVIQGAVIQDSLDFREHPQSSGFCLLGQRFQHTFFIQVFQHFRANGLDIWLLKN